MPPAHRRLTLPICLVILAAALTPYSPAQTLASVSEKTNATPAKQTVPEIGVAAHLRRPQQFSRLSEILALIKDAGISWVRHDIYWREIEPTKGAYQIPDSLWTVIAECEKAGLKLIFIFNRGNDIYAPDIYNPDAYAAAAAWFSKQTAGRVQAIEILNEPANFGFTKHYGGTWNGIDPKTRAVEPWLEKYVTLLNKSADAIKAQNPDVKVIGLGSVAPVNFRQIAMGLSPAVDGIVDHPYSFRLTPELVPFASSEGILARDGIKTADERGTLASQIRMYRECLDKFKSPKELWLTEWGWPTYQEAKSGGIYAGVTQSAQAKYILRRLMETFGLNVAVTVVYDIMNDGPNPYDAEHNFGLLNSNLEPKPAYFAVQKFSKFMKNCRPEKRLEVNVFPVETRPDQYPIVWDGSKIGSSGKIMSYQFSDGDANPVISLWSSERADGDLNPLLAEVEIFSDRVPREIIMHDLLTGTDSSPKFELKGKRIVLKQIPIPDYPIALTLK